MAAMVICNTNEKARSTPQNKCLRIISVQYANTHLDALRLETGVHSYATQSKQLIATAYEKGMRLPDQHPRHAALNVDVKHRLDRSSLREKVKEVIEGISIEGTERRQTEIAIPQPWSDRHKNWEVFTNETIKDDIPAVKSAVQDLGAEVTIYTDGSCTGGTRDGGAAAVATIGHVEDPACIEVCKAKGDMITTSYEEERRALHLGIEWLGTTQYSKAAFCTDSLSFLKSMDVLNPETASTR